MRKVGILIFLTAVFLFQGFKGCDETISPISNSFIEGDVYSIGTPGPISEGWTPPRYNVRCTIKVLNEVKALLLEQETDQDGHFKINISPGIYYLVVKESLIPAETGPYELNENQTLAVEAHYDNGMR